MPNITIIKENLFTQIGRHFTNEEFDEICFEFGVEIDGIEKQIIEVKE